MSALSGIYFHAYASALLPLIFIAHVLSTLVTVYICGFLGSVDLHMGIRCCDSKGNTRICFEDNFV